MTLIDPGLASQIHVWASDHFPDQNLERLARHLVEECQELETATEAADAAPGDEWIGTIVDNLADVAILLSELEARVHYEADTWGVDLTDAVARKHAVNVTRSWEFDPERGYDRHVEPEAVQA